MRINEKTLFVLFLLVLSLFVCGKCKNVRAATICNEGVIYSNNFDKYECQYSPVQNGDVCVLEVQLNSGVCRSYAGSMCIYNYMESNTCYASGGVCQVSGGGLTTKNCWITVPDNQITPVVTIPPPTGVVTCPACCSSSLCQGTRYSDRDGLCGGDTICCDSCGGNFNYEPYGNVFVYFYNDTNRNGFWNPGETRILDMNDSKINGGTLSWSGGSDGVPLGAGTTIVAGFPRGAFTAQHRSGDTCGLLEVVSSAWPPLFIDRNNSFSSDFDIWSLRDTTWSHDDACLNAMKWGYSSGGVSYNPFNIRVKVHSGGSNVTFTYTPAVGSSYIASKSSISTYISPDWNDGPVDVEAIAFGIALPPPPLPNPPMFSSLDIYNSISNLVPAVGGRNHICQSDFRSPANPRQVNFSVTISDVDGFNQIDDIRMRFSQSGNVYLTVLGTSLAASPSWNVLGDGSALVNFVGSPKIINGGITRTVEFPILFNNNFDRATGFRIHDLEVYARDITGQTLNWTDAGRDFKVWDCQIPVSGTLFDVSGTTVVCPNTGYSTPVGANYYTGVSFNGINMSHNVSSANFNSPVGVGLTWGVSYSPTWTGLNGSSPANRRLSGVGVASFNCAATSGFRLDESTGFDAYVTSIGATIDYTSVADQDPWFQGRGVSILGRTSVRSEVPVTCTGSCVGALNVDNTGREDNGAVISSSLSSTAGTWGSNNNWYRNSYNQAIKTLGYTTMLNSLNGKTGVRTATNWSEVRGVGGTGVVFVNGPLNIDVDNSVSSGRFLMVVVNGNLNIGVGASRVEGAYLVNGNIVADGMSAQVLDINGMIYATGDILFTRGFTTLSQNNTNPAVRVNIRPDLIFNAPSYMFERLSYIK